MTSWPDPGRIFCRAACNFDPLREESASKFDPPLIRWKRLPRNESARQWRWCQWRRSARYGVRGTFTGGPSGRSRSRWACRATRSARCCGYAGSSPRGRGTVRKRVAELEQQRFIPAWAGNRSAGCPAPSPPPVHPRVGGEQHTLKRYSNDLDGSSPRGRGTAMWSRRNDEYHRFIPAWAGNSEDGSAIIVTDSVHPRVGGEQCTA